MRLCGTFGNRGVAGMWETGTRQLRKVVPLAAAVALAALGVVGPRRRECRVQAASSCFL